MVAAGVVVLLLALTGCGGSGVCSPATCDGCCDEKGSCQAGGQAAACGSAGGRCASCTAQQQCLQGACYGTVGTDGGACDAGGELSCGPLCVRPATDVEHCGRCFSKCSIPNATAACVDGACAVGECASGHRDLDGQLANGCEASCEPLGIATSGSLDVELASAQLSGRVTFEGRSAPSGTSRGALHFVLAGSARPLVVPLPATGEATFSARLFQGSYRILFVKGADCRPEALPCGSQELRAGFPVTTSGSLDLDVKRAGADGGIPGDGGMPLTVSGEVTVNGAALPDAPSARGFIEFRQGTVAVASQSLGNSGRGTYSVQLPPGTYDVALRGAASCSGSQPLPCQLSVRKRALGLSTSGSFNLDAPVTTLSGEVKANGASLPAASASRGVIRFSDGDGNGPGFALPASGPATYSLKLYPGTHSVTVSNSAGCAAGPLPCQSRRALEAVQVVPSPASLDVDLPVVSLSGQVRANGTALGSSGHGGVRGALTFKEGTGGVLVPLGTSGPATFQGLLLYAGEYDVVVSNDTDCVDGPLPCGSTPYARAVPLKSSGSYEVDLRVVRITGEVTANKARLGDSPTGASRGQLTFDGPISTGVVLPASGPATFGIALYPGVYDVVFANGTGDCPRGPTPCQSRVLERKRSLSVSGALALDLPVVELSGQVRVDGALAPSSNGAPRGRLRFEQEDAGDVAVALGSSGPAQYQVRLFPGAYAVRFENLADCAAGSAFPCQSATTLQSALSVTSTGALDFDVRTVTLSGVVRLDGAPLGASANGVSRGAVRFGEARGGSAQAALTASGPASYTVRVVKGSYDLGFFNEADCPDGATPCQDVLVKGCNLP